jgi:hypothetical protein
MLSQINPALSLLFLLPRIYARNMWLALVLTEQKHVPTELENIFTLQMYETRHCTDKYAHLCGICWL